MASVANAFLSIILQQIIDISVMGDIEQFFKIMRITGAYLIALFLLGLVSALSVKKVIRNVTRDIREDVFIGIMRKTPVDFYIKNNADYISVLTNDVKLIEENYIASLLITIEMTVLFVATIGILLYLSPLVTVCLIGGMLLVFIIPSFLGKILEKRQEKVSKTLSLFTVKIKDFFSGFEVIRGYRIFPYIKIDFDKQNKRTADIKYNADKIIAINESLSELLTMLIIIIVVFVSAFLMMDGKISIGTLIALVQLSGTFMVPVVMIMQNLPKIKGIAPVIDRIEQFSSYSNNEFTGTNIPLINKSIEVKDLNFSYNPESATKAIDGVNLAFEIGKKYAIVGHSGSGKSTLIKLLTGYSSEYTGQILYDGKELKELDVDELITQISTIHQNIFLFDATIRENINLYGDFSEEQWERALAVSGINLFMDDEKTLYSEVGENGNNLSGGQRQRVAVARTLVRETPIVILDEGTSSIDRKTAEEIENNLLAQHNITIINVTHTLTEEMLRKYDGIVIMKDGKVLDIGRYDEISNLVYSQ